VCHNKVVVFVSLVFFPDWDTNTWCNLLHFCPPLLQFTVSPSIYQWFVILQVYIFVSHISPHRHLFTSSPLTPDLSNIINNNHNSTSRSRCPLTSSLVVVAQINNHCCLRITTWTTCLSLVQVSGTSKGFHTRYNNTVSVPRLWSFTDTVKTSVKQFIESQNLVVVWRFLWDCLVVLVSPRVFSWTTWSQFFC
jgi:hypothetical protein